MTHKISKTYRLSQLTLTMIRDLRAMTGAASETEILETAVARWHGAEREESTMEIHVTIVKSDVEDWLNPEDETTPDQLDTWAEQYREALQAKMQDQNPGKTVTVEWGSRDHIIVEGVTDWEQEYHALDSARTDYEWACDQLTDFEWMH